MSESSQGLKVHFSPRVKASETVQNAQLDVRSSEPSTCTDAEPFALRVLDDSMEPEFRKGCIIVIDPTGLARDGAYVLARLTDGNEDDDDTDGFVFRQLRRFDTQWTLEPLNTQYESLTTAVDLSEIVGVVVQRAGTRRRYHKRYE